MQALQAGVIAGVREPYDWARVLEWLGTRAIPGLESVAGGVFRRGGIAVRFADGALRVEGGEPDPGVIARVFDAEHDPAAVAEAWSDSAEASALLGRARHPRPRRVERLGARRAGRARAAGQRRGCAQDGGEARRAPRRRASRRPRR